MKLTERTITGLPAPDPSGKQKLYWDDEPKGFGVLCSGVTNTKTFILQRAVERQDPADNHRPGARHRRARSRTRGPRPARNCPTSSTRGSTRRTTRPAGRFAQRWRSTSPSRSLMPRTAAFELSRRRRAPAQELARPAAGRDHPDHGPRAPRRLTKASGKAAADGTMRVLRAVYNNAAYLSTDAALPPNPVRLRGSWHKPPPRKGHVSAEELAAFHQAGDGAGLPGRPGPDPVPALHRLPAAGGHHAAVEGRDFDEEVIRLAAATTKSKRTLELPMSDLVHDLLERRREVGDAGLGVPG